MSYTPAVKEKSENQNKKFTAKTPNDTHKLMLHTSKRYPQVNVTHK